MQQRVGVDRGPLASSSTSCRPFGTLRSSPSKTSLHSETKGLLDTGHAKQPAPTATRGPLPRCWHATTQHHGVSGKECWANLSGHLTKSCLMSMTVQTRLIQRGSEQATSPWFLTPSCTSGRQNTGRNSCQTSTMGCWHVWGRPADKARSPRALSCRESTENLGATLANQQAPEMRDQGSDRSLRCQVNWTNRFLCDKLQSERS